MKKIIYLLVLLSIISAREIFPQKGQKEDMVYRTKTGKPGYVVVNSSEGLIKITGYNGSDVIIKNPFKNTREFKENISVSTDEAGNGVDISTDEYDLEIKVPASFSLTLNNSEGRIEVFNTTGEMSINNSEGAIRLINISGTCMVSSESGDVFAELNSFTGGTPILINTIDGKIDITVPAWAKADVTAGSESGNVYTDFEISMDRKSSGHSKPKKEGGLIRVASEEHMTGSINGGGEDIVLRSIDGNIYLRKKK